jgi:hypothetical protein
MDITRRKDRVSIAVPYGTHPLVVNVWIPGELGGSPDYANAHVNYPSTMIDDPAVVRELACALEMAGKILVEIQTSGDGETQYAPKEKEARGRMEEIAAGKYRAAPDARAALRIMDDEGTSAQTRASLVEDWLR